MLGFFNGKESGMPKDVKVPLPTLPEVIEPDRRYAKPSRETDEDAADNLLSAHRRIKQELTDAKRMANDALVELKVRGDVIVQRDVEIASLRNQLGQEKHRADQAAHDCAALENLFQNIAALTNSFLLPIALKREQSGHSEFSGREIEMPPPATEPTVSPEALING